MSVNIKRQEIGTLKEVLFGEEISRSMILLVV
nr:MAG TPA: hypothetical protein [Caudoviricetes sp.]